MLSYSDHSYRVFHQHVHNVSTIACLLLEVKGGSV